MKKLAILSLLVLAMTVNGCGNSSTPTTATTTGSGTWEAQLTGGTGDASVLNFVTTFSVNGDGSLSVTGFTFLTTGSCFVSGETATGTSTLTTSGTGVVSGPVSYTVTSGTPAGNTLSLSGTENGTTITGTWTLTGGNGCSGAGSFTMTKQS